MTSEIYIIVRENKKTGAVQLYIKNFDLKIRKKQLKVELENITGGGFVGKNNKIVTSKIVSLLGEDFLNSSKAVINEKLKELLRTELLKFFGLDS